MVASFLLFGACLVWPLLSIANRPVLFLGIPVMVLYLFGVWAAIVILCREILVSGLREYLAALRVSVPVTKLAKWKTTIQLVAIGFLIAGEAGEQILPATTLIGIALLWMSALFTIYTGWDYFRAGIHHLIKEDEG